MADKEIEEPVNEPSRSDSILSRLKIQTSASNNEHIKSHYFPTLQKESKAETIDEKIRKQKIENDNRVSDQNLKKITLIILFIFLSIETITTFTLAFFQGFKTGGFLLDTWSFRIVIIATLGQITAMLTIAVRHLFPHNRRR